MSTLLDRFASLIPMVDVKEKCPYFEGREATFRGCDGVLVAPLFRELLDNGFRRNGNVVYRPVCQGCSECKVLRVPIASFQRSKAQRRVWNRLEGLIDVKVVRPTISREKLKMYHDYLVFQHGDTDGAANPESYRAFLMDSCLGSDTIETDYYINGKLAGVGILDRMKDALSSVYFYFHPDYARYSLGTYSILHEIELARNWKYTYYYLGYYIAGCAAMSYKSSFKPCEIKDTDGKNWHRISR